MKVLPSICIIFVHLLIRKKQFIMAFEATKRELGELYTFFRLLANGKVSLGTPQARKDETKC